MVEMRKGGRRSSDNKRWAELRDAALSVVWLSQRDEGLWYYPSSPFDRSLSYAPGGSSEEEIRTGEFGAASISVSWVALRALSKVLGDARPQVDQVLQALTRHRSTDGAYGSLAARANAPAMINKSARHVATAMLLRMAFNPEAPHQELEQSARWLTQTHPSGSGWPFAEADRERGPGPTTTSYCIAALTHFRARFESRVDPTLVLQIGRVLDESFSWLVGARQSYLWDGGSEGIVEATRTADSAYIVWTLAHAVAAMRNRGPDDAADATLRFRRDFLAHALPTGGWPANEVSAVAALSATICSLFALTTDVAPNIYAPAELETIRAAEAFVLGSMDQPLSWRRLRMWDWATLAVLAEDRCAPLSEADRLSYASLLAGMKAVARRSDDPERVLTALPRQSQAAALYCLTRRELAREHHGDPLPKRHQMPAPTKFGVSPRASRVFIGHGGSPVWREVALFLTDRLGVPFEEFNSASAVGRTTAGRLDDMLNECNFAILVMTGEDRLENGKMLARQNVAHEVGLFQGRLGFDKAIVLLEEGCEEFSNIAGIVQIRFPFGKVSGAFEAIRQTLERENLL